MISFSASGERSSDAFKQLMLKALISPLFLRNNDGRKFLGYQFALHAPFVQLQHTAIKNQVGRSACCHSVGPPAYPLRLPSAADVCVSRTMNASRRLCISNNECRSLSAARRCWPISARSTGVPGKAPKDRCGLAVP